MASQASQSQAPAENLHEQTPVIVRPLPKVVFFYPAMLVSIIAAFGTYLDEPHRGIYGAAFMIVFGINLLAVGFDITHTVALGGGLTFLVALFGALYANEYFNVVGWLREITSHIHLYANPQFYAIFALLIFITELIALMIAMLDYWVITPNEIIHRHGVPRNVERMPAPQVRVNKEIQDVLEYLLLQSGKLILHGSDMGQAIVLDNVARVNHKEARIQRLLGAMQVDVVEVDHGVNA